MKRKKLVLLGLLTLLIGALVLAGCSPRQSQAPAPEEDVMEEEAPTMDEQIAEEPVEDEETVEVPETQIPADEVPETNPGAEPIPETDPEAEPIPETNPEPEPIPEPEIALSGTLVGGVREIRVVASQFDFGPDVITVRQGEEVRLLLTTDDVAHGIGLREFGINANIAAGETTVVTFVADTSGEFTFFCSVPCGAGHGSMTGQLIVI